MARLALLTACVFASQATGAFASPPGAGAGATPRPIIYVLPLGDELPAADVAAVEAALAAF
jgi:hypothetical protein